MDQVSTESLKDYLFSHDQRFRELSKEHTRFESRLSELSSLAHPSDDELDEERAIKKQKLFIKDQMELIARNYRGQVGH